MSNRRRRKRPLSIRQQKFVEQFLITGVAREAAIRAGYAAANVGKTAWRLRRLPAVATAIRLGRSAEARRAQVARERVLLELARVAFSDIGEVLDWTGGDDIALRPKAEISPHMRAAIAEIAPRRYGKGPRIKLHSKSRALDALARHFGIFDKVVPAVPPPYARKDGRDARTILLERLARLKRTRDEAADAESRAAASLAAGAPLGIPSFADNASSDGSPPPQPSPFKGEGSEKALSSSSAFSGESHEKKIPSPLEGEGRVGGEARNTPTAAAIHTPAPELPSQPSTFPASVWRFRG